MNFKNKDFCRRTKAEHIFSVEYFFLYIYIICLTGGLNSELDFFVFDLLMLLFMRFISD